MERAKYFKLHCSTPEAVPCNETLPPKKSKSAMDILLGEEASESEINHSNSIEADLSHWIPIQYFGGNKITLDFLFYD